MDYLAQVLVMGAATAALSITLSRAKVFGWLRSWIASKSPKAGELISCDYCTSHWIAVGVMVLAYWNRFLPLEWTTAIVTWAAVVGFSAVFGTVILKRD